MRGPTFFLNRAPAESKFGLGRGVETWNENPADYVDLTVVESCLGYVIETIQNRLALARSKCLVVT